jgi:hypothetical protein
MSFNADKCKVMHTVKDNLGHKYCMKGTLLGTTEEDKVVGVYINPTLKPGGNCRKATNKAMGVFKQMTKFSTKKIRTHLLKLYKRYISSHLEFVSPAWSPRQTGDINMIKKSPGKSIEDNFNKEKNTGYHSGVQNPERNRQNGSRRNIPSPKNNQCCRFASKKFGCGSRKKSQCRCGSGFMPLLYYGEPSVSIRNL